MQTHLPLTYEALKALCEQPPVPTIDPQTGLRVVINRHGFTTAWLEVYGRHGYMQVTVVLSDPTEWSNSVCHQSWSTSERPQLDAYGVDLPKEYWPDDLKQTYLRMLLLERNSATASRTAREVAHRFPRSRYMGRVDTFMAARVRRARLTDLMREAMRDDDTESRELGDSIRDALDNLATYSSGTAERVALALEARGWDDYIPVEADCGHVELRCDMQTIGGFGGLDEQTVCQGCWDDEVVCVEPHGGYARRDDVFYWESDDCYHLSEEPDFDEDEDDGRLSYGTDALDHLSIDRSFETRVDGDFHMGIELEVETKYRDGVRDAIEDMRDHFRSSYAIYKSDGSLSASGIEIVTQPTSLGRHVEKFSTWTPAPSLRAWDTGRCGMHVHIDSRAFSALTLGKFITFFNDTKNATFIRQIAGRHPAQDHQAQTYAGFDVDSSTISSPAKVLVQPVCDGEHVEPSPVGGRPTGPGP